MEIPIAGASFWGPIWAPPLFLADPIPITLTAIPTASQAPQARLKRTKKKAWGGHRADDSHTDDGDSHRLTGAAGATEKKKKKGVGRP